MRQTLQILFYIAFGYLSGSVLYANIWSRLLHKEEMLRESRDGNPGAANAFQYGGFGCGVLTLCGDFLKGFIPVFLYGTFVETTMRWTVSLVLAAPVIGHILPIFWRFRGGKGIAVTFGCLFGLLPELRPFLIFAAVFIVLSVCVRITPHFYRTVVTYLCTAILLFVFRIEPAVCVGFLCITAAVCVRFFCSREDKGRMKVRLLWKR